MCRLKKTIVDLLNFWLLFFQEKSNVNFYRRNTMKINKDLSRASIREEHKIKKALSQEDL